METKEKTGEVKAIPKRQLKAQQVFEQLKSDLLKRIPKEGETWIAPSEGGKIFNGNADALRLLEREGIIERGSDLNYWKLKPPEVKGIPKELGELYYVRNDIPELVDKNIGLREATKSVNKVRFDEEFKRQHKEFISEGEWVYRKPDGTEMNLTTGKVKLPATTPLKAVAGKVKAIPAKLEPLAQEIKRV